MKKLATVIIGTLLLMSSTFANGTTGENVNGCGAGSTCGECSNQGARGQAEVDSTVTPRTPGDHHPAAPVITK